jgi:hypothetical protein
MDWVKIAQTSSAKHHILRQNFQNIRQPEATQISLKTHDRPRATAVATA